jgi:ABC-type multidrug transport system ATPase subunit
MPYNLSIKNFKNIHTEIKLKELGLINYLVGKNGSGKSSIINSMALGISNEPVWEDFLGPEGFVMLESDNSFIKVSKIEDDSIIKQGELNPLPAVIDTHARELPTLGLYRASFPDIQNMEMLDFFNSTLDKFNLDRILAERVVVSKNAFDSQTGKTIFITEGNEITPAFYAEGYQALNALIYLFSSITKELEEHLRQRDPIVFLIEEPENKLHPSLQKIIPQLLTNLVNEYLAEYKKKIIIFISTHSPFLISGAAKLNEHKVYLVEKGHLIDLENNIVNISEGYHGNECAWIVGQMLGSDVTDLGYPENYCILEEHSLQLILDECKRKGIIRNIQFISASGHTRQVSISETVNELVNLNTLVKCNPYYLDKYLFIIDNTEDFTKKEKEKITKIAERLGNRYLELSKRSIENFYGNLDSKIQTAATEEIKIASKTEVGQVKAKFAKLISEHINSKENFSKLFQTELDFLF